MVEVAGIFAGQMAQAATQNRGQTQAAEGCSFIDALRPWASGKIAVAGRSYLEELGLRKKERLDFDSYDFEEEAEEDIFTLIAKMRDFLKRMGEK